MLVNIAHFQKLRLFPAMTIGTVEQRMAQKMRAALSPPFQFARSLLVVCLANPFNLR
jgi:hypothetical protein